MTQEKAQALFEKWVRILRLSEFDYEQILVHELMHLKLSLVDDPDDRMIGAVVHQLVDDLAKSLVAASRGNAVGV